MQKSGVPGHSKIIYATVSAVTKVRPFHLLFETSPEAVQNTESSVERCTCRLIFQCKFQLLLPRRVCLMPFDVNFLIVLLYLAPPAPEYFHIFYNTERI